MRKLIAIVLTAAGLYAGADWWRRNRRVGAEFVNRIVDPWLVARGVVGASRGELGMLEHVGRKSGAVRRTPVHPVPTADGFRIIVPLGQSSQWARNVLAAGHCRLELGDRVLELDEPVIEQPTDVAGLGPVVAAIYRWLGFEYLRLRTLREPAFVVPGRPGDVASPGLGDAVPAPGDAFTVAAQS
jgi:deazaflavin-dependent oxidoreductase (nitroreductase family)